MELTDQVTRDVADGLGQATVKGPIAPREGGELDGIEAERDLERIQEEIEARVSRIRIIKPGAPST